MSNRFLWKTEYSVGIGSVDLEHQQLIALMAELHRAILENPGEAATFNILISLIEYIKTHFANEARMLKKHHYSKTAQHLAEHRAFVTKAFGFLKKAQADGLPPQDVLSFLQDWLVTHIQVSDQDYAREFRENGVGHIGETDDQVPLS